MGKIWLIAIKINNFWSYFIYLIIHEIQLNGCVLTNCFSKYCFNKSKHFSYVALRLAFLRHVQIILYYFSSSNTYEYL